MRAAELLRRLAQSLVGGAIAGLAVAALEAFWTNASAGSEAPGLTPALLALLPIVTPLMLVASLTAGLATLWLSPTEPPTLGTLIRWLRTQAAGRRADVAAVAPLLIGAAFIWATASAQLARAVLGLNVSPRLAGLAVLTGSLGLGLVLSILTLAALPPARRTLATWAERRPVVVDPAATAALGITIAGAAFAFGIHHGSVSGEGGFLGIWGIFKRPELDLRAPLELFVIAGAAVFAQSVAQPPRSIGLGSLAACSLLALAPLALLGKSSAALNESPALALAVERGAPISKLLVGPLRRMSDRDGDGYGSAFGGGDCDDTRADVHPGATEILDNGIDEDCSGADLTKRAIDALAPSAEAQKVDERLFPQDLNVILITVDTLRFDLGALGYERPISPNLDALAARSVLFERAYSLASYTGKSVGPMLIGKYGSETDRNWGHFNKFGSKDTFLAQRLQKTGMRTMAVHAHRYFDDFGGLERGFDVLDFSAAPGKDAPWDIDTKATSQQLTDAAIGLLGKPENTDGRFFMWIHYLDPHADYLKHEGIDFGKSARDLYDGEVAFTDRHIGRLLEKISSSPWGNRTAIIVSSDHGEAFGDHGMYRHGFEVWESLVRVPLIVHVPGAKPKRVLARRSLIDLVPTVLELTHIAAPEESAAESGDFLSGQSWLVDVFLPDGEQHATRDVFVDMPAGPYNDARRALIHNDHKLIVAGDARFSLYDLAADPGETHELSSKDRAALTEMKDRYAALKARLREIKVTGKRK